jgi:hypothetical protein
MGQIDLFRPRFEALSVAKRDDIVSQYQRLRTVGWDLNNRLVKRLSKDVLEEGGTKLGMLEGKVFVVDTEDEVSILMDYCIYDVRRDGRNAIDQYLIDSPPDPESDEMTCLRSRQHPIYSLFVVESVERGLGVIARDMLSGEVFRVVDMGLGISGQPGMVFVARLLHHDGFSMSSGATVPFGFIRGAEDEDELIKGLSLRPKLDDDSYFDPASLIRRLLRAGALRHVQYVDPRESMITQQQVPNRSRVVPVGRNSPCPCGSGKKFKRCCIEMR